MTPALASASDVSPLLGRSNLRILLPLLLLAAAVRLPMIGSVGVSLDEMWTQELAAGHASAHLSLPFNVPLKLHDLTAIDPGTSSWSIWTHMQGCTHPPLYYLTLRWWDDIFGSGDTAGRVYSAVTSLLLITVFFDVVRLLNGRRNAVWACVLLALAEPQVAYARSTRNYMAMLLCIALAADAVVRIEKLGGVNWRRWFGLASATAVAMLVHYFSAGALLGIAVYAAVRLRGKNRGAVLAAFFAAAVLFAVCWGPLMWQQRDSFSTGDPATLFLQNAGPGHILHTLGRVAALPVRLLIDPPADSVALSYAGVVLYVLPFVLARRRPDLLFWGMLMAGTVGTLLIMDLARKTDQLGYLRYPFPATLAVCALLPALFSQGAGGMKWIGATVLGLIVAGCVGSLPQAYVTQGADPRDMAGDVAKALSPRSLLICVGAGDFRWHAGWLYMTLGRYAFHAGLPVVLLDAPPDAAIQSLIDASDQVFVLTMGEDGTVFAPGCNVIGYNDYLNFCKEWQLTPPKKHA